MTEDIQTKSQALLFYVPVTVKPDVLLRATLRTSAAVLTSANYSQQTVNQVSNAAAKVCLQKKNIQFVCNLSTLRVRILQAFKGLLLLTSYCPLIVELLSLVSKPQ